MQNQLAQTIQRKSKGVAVGGSERASSGPGVQTTEAVCEQVVQSILMTGGVLTNGREPKPLGEHFCATVKTAHGELLVQPSKLQVKQHTSDGRLLFTEAQYECFQCRKWKRENKTDERPFVCRFRYDIGTGIFHQLPGHHRHNHPPVPRHVGVATTDRLSRVPDHIRTLINVCVEDGADLSPTQVNHIINLITLFRESKNRPPWMKRVFGF